MGIGTSSELTQKIKQLENDNEHIKTNYYLYQNQYNKLYTEHKKIKKLLNNNTNSINNFANKIISKIPKIKFKNKSFIQIGILGPTSSGKSTFINTLTNQQNAEIGVDNTTNKIEVYTYKKNIKLYDFPGTNELLKYGVDANIIYAIKSLDYIYILYNNAINEIYAIYNILIKHNIPFSLIRTQLDQMFKFKSSLSEFDKNRKIQSQKKKDYAWIENNCKFTTRIFFISCLHIYKNRANIEPKQPKFEELIGFYYAHIFNQ
jgi:GTPase Era involved in 16S rRNA processing